MNNKNPESDIGVQPKNQKSKAVKPLEKSYLYQGWVIKAKHRRVSLCHSPSCPGTRFCRSGYLWTHRDLPASASWVLGSKVCTATSWLSLLPVYIPISAWIKSMWLLSSGIKGVSHHHLNMFLHWTCVAWGGLELTEIHLPLFPKSWD